MPWATSCYGWRASSDARSIASAITPPRSSSSSFKESHEGGLLRGESGQLLRDLFAFGDRTAGEVMVPRVLLAGIPVGPSPTS